MSNALIVEAELALSSWLAASRIQRTKTGRPIDPREGEVSARHAPLGDQHANGLRPLPQGDD